MSETTPINSIKTPWTKESWKSFPIQQKVIYPDSTSTSDSLESVLIKLESLPPLVSAVEIERLKLNLAQVSKGEAFLLQAGSCAELFEYATATKIENHLSLLLSMSLILIWGMKLPVVRVARMGGQYAKPRSSPTEIINGVEVPSFRGDNINGYPLSERTPTPQRLLGAYFHSASTVNHVRSLLSSGFASLPTAKGESVPWSLPLLHVKDEALLRDYEKIVGNLSEALEFMKVVGGGSEGGKRGGLESADIWMSHEGLMLDYETALTRELKIPAFARKEGDKETGFYCTSAHFIWIGDRTRSITGAHVEFFRGLRNPIGIKVGPTMTSEELIRLLNIVNPEKEEGRITLIGRYGADLVGKYLPDHIKAVQSSGHPVIFCSDPMHGNTKSVPLPASSTSTSIKTRAMSDIVTELSESLKIHESLGSRLGGVHLELTGDVDEDGFSVTECTGGSMELSEEELALRFESYCDPRLNFEQSLDVAFMLSSQYQSLRSNTTTSPNNSNGSSNSRGRTSGGEQGGGGSIFSSLVSSSRNQSLSR